MVVFRVLLIIRNWRQSDVKQANRRIKLVLCVLIVIMQKTNNTVLRIASKHMAHIANTDKKLIVSLLKRYQSQQPSKLKYESGVNTLDDYFGYCTEHGLRIFNTLTCMSPASFLRHFTPYLFINSDVEEPLHVNLTVQILLMLGVTMYCDSKDMRRNLAQIRWLLDERHTTLESMNICFYTTANRYNKITPEVINMLNQLSVKQYANDLILNNSKNLDILDALSEDARNRFEMLTKHITQLKIKQIIQFDCPVQAAFNDVFYGAVNTIQCQYHTIYSSMCQHYTTSLSNDTTKIMGFPLCNKMHMVLIIPSNQSKWCLSELLEEMHIDLTGDRGCILYEKLPYVKTRIILPIHRPTSAHIFHVGDSTVICENELYYSTAASQDEHIAHDSTTDTTEFKLNKPFYRLVFSEKQLLIIDRVDEYTLVQPERRLKFTTK